MSVWYLRKIVAFSHHGAGNVANLSRIDPSLLGINDGIGYGKNVLHLHGHSSGPLLCFSLVLVARDDHEHGCTLGSDKEWVIKDIAGIMLAMELEHLVAVLGLAYQLPYVPEDSARREEDLLHFSMVDNAFCFASQMSSKSGELIYLYML
jgi:hypothetical protein